MISTEEQRVFRMREVRRWIALGFLLLVAACESTESRWAALPERERGTLFGMIKAERTRVLGGTPISHGLWIRNVATKETIRIRISANDKSEPALREGSRFASRQFEIIVPTGRYEIFDVETEIEHQKCYSARPFSLPLSVEAGVINYVGEFHAYPLKGKNLLGWTVPAGGYFVIRDRLERDLAVLEKRRGTPVALPVTNSVPNADLSLTPLLSRQSLVGAEHDGAHDATACASGSTASRSPHVDLNM